MKPVMIAGFGAAAAITVVAIAVASISWGNTPSTELERGELNTPNFPDSELTEQPEGSEVGSAEDNQIV